MDNRTVYYAPLPPKPATLFILEKGRNSSIVRLSGDMTLGRKSPDSYSDITLNSCIVSRNHGEFLFIDGAYYYKDNNSLNGTFINGYKLEGYNERGSRAVKLVDGDIIRIDRSQLDVPHNEAVEMIFSTTFSADEQWQVYPLGRNYNIKIGRNIDDGISLADFMASRNHAMLQFIAGRWKIVDNNSRNGVSVNKNQIEREQFLNPLDVIRIANTTLIFTGSEIIYNSVNSSLKKTGSFDYSNRSVIMNINIEEVKAKRGMIGKKKTLLKDINLDIESGDFILVLGGAGAGKSTFIKAITGQNHDTEQTLDIKGQIFLEGMNLYKNLRVLKHKIGIVPQYPDYRANDTVYNTIMDSARLQLSSEYSKQEIKQRVDDIIESMMLTSIKDSMLGIISGGQRKRVQVAIKSVGDISFFTFDEPDAGLDVAGRVDQMKQITKPITPEQAIDNSQELKYCTDSGKAGLMISHYPDDVADMYKKVIVLAKSKVDDAGHLAYYGDIPNALSFFGVNKLSEIVLEINYEGGKGRGDEFIQKFERTRRG
ncbi:MAG: FHA domain-containing protein [Ruminococcus sp.]|nr:FHA domain-containing protein [Ruminococcus sp.]MDE6848408.1 FHA domain-containing protein [Ruminococcus sp.]